MNLRPYQQKLETELYAAWNAGAKNVLVQLPTGGGKTVFFSKVISDNRGASVAIAHRQELVSQISLTLARNGVRHRVIGPSALKRSISALHLAEIGRDYVDTNSPRAVAGIDTLIRAEATDPWFSQVTLVVQDEAHHVLRENKWGQAAGMFPNARGLYPTATPIRADGNGLGRHADGIIDAMVVGPSMRDLIDAKYLCDYRVYAPPSDLDLSMVAISNATGDFNAPQVRAAVHKSHITGDVVEHYMRLAPGKLGVTFAVDVEAATEIATAFRARGVPAEVVSAKTPDLLRVNIMRQFRAREVLQLVNVDLLGEGVDVPAIEVVSFARPTQSFSLFTQQFGRALRPLEGKDRAIIIDHVGNTLRHGLPDARREWSLDRRERRSSSKVSDAIPTRTCLSPTCLLVYERAYKCCPYCGHYPEPPARSAPEHVDGDLLELDAEILAAMRGDIARIDGPAIAPRGVDGVVRMAIEKRHCERQQAQAALRVAMDWYSGLQDARGAAGIEEKYRRFYLQFGIDTASAQTLGAPEAEKLRNRICEYLLRYGIDATVNSAIA